MSIDPADVDVDRLAAAAVEFSADGIVVVDERGVIRYANIAMHELAGATGPLVGTGIDSLVPERVRGRHADLRAGYARTPHSRPMGADLRLTMQRADGSELPVEIALSPFEADGLHVVAAVRDVSERQRAQQLLAAADRQLALLDERERIGRDLHDVVLQRLFATGLSVQAVGNRVDESSRQRLDGVVDEIDRIIAEVRTIVFTLGHSGRDGSLGQQLADVVAQSSRVLGFTPSLRVDGPVESSLSVDARVELVASLREALGNVARHADASGVDIVIRSDDGQVMLTVADDGSGPPAPGSTSTGNGLANLRARAAQFGGSCELHRNEQGGASLVWSVPF